AEAPKRLLTTIERNAWPAVRNLDPDLFFSRLDAHRDIAADGPVTDRIFQEIAERLGEQLPMSEERHGPVGPIEAYEAAAFVSERIVHLGELRGQFADVEPCKLVSAGECL